MPEGLEAYTCTGEEGDYLTLKKEICIAAFTPYILYAENGFCGTLCGTTDAETYPAEGQASDGYLTGVLKKTEVTSGYILQDQGAGPMFYKVGATPFSLPAGKCFCNPAIPMSASSLSIRYGEDSAIDLIATAERPSAPVYDLQGRIVAKPQSGCIYVINGKKVLKK